MAVSSLGIQRIDTRQIGKFPREQSEVGKLRAARGPVRLLLAEDDSDMRELIASELRGDGWDVLEASDGRELAQMLDRLVVDPGSMPLVDLVVTDVRMPGPSGLEVLEDLRAWSLAPPVIVITAFGDAELHELALRLGAAAVLDKPFDVDELRMLARTLVPLRGGTTPPTSRRHA